jgi:hypothetical protein
MHIKNHIVNYFVTFVEGKSSPKVFRSPITVDSRLAKKLISKQFGDIVFKSDLELFHVCYDLESRILYTPNANEFSKDKYEIFVQAARLRIMKDFKGDKASHIMHGSPYSLIRVRSIESFPKIEDVFGHLINDRINRCSW